MVKRIKKLITAVLALIIIGGTVLSVPVYAQNVNESNVSDNRMSTNSYKDYRESFEESVYPNLNITSTVDTAVLGAGVEPLSVEINKKPEKAIFFSQENSSAVFKFSVAESGFYNIEFVYKTVAKANNLAAIEIDLSIDGKSYDWLKSIKLDRLWTDDGEIIVDKIGNDVAPTQKEYEIWNTTFLYDSQKIMDKPLYYYFEAGEHSLSVKNVRGEFYLNKINILNKPEAQKYANVSKKFPVNSSPKDFLKIIEAEDYLFKSSIGIVPATDPSSAATSPNDPVHTKLNIISGSNFKETGSFIEWELDVPEDGLYCIDMRVRQNYNSGLSSVRSLTIDGEFPFKECEAISFEYSGDWHIKSLGSKTPYMFYLTKGRHNLRLTASKGALADTVHNSEQLIYKLNDLYNTVIMVVGVNPDKYRDYKLEEEIPEIKKTITDLYDELEKIRLDVERVSGGKSGSASATIHTLLTLLSTVKERPDKLCLKLDNLRNNIESLGTWVNNLVEQPLDIDYIRIYSPDTELPTGNVNFFVQTGFEIRRLLKTFVDDYDANDKDKKQLSVWLSTGFEQMEIIKRLIENDYMQKNNTNIKLALTTEISGAVLAGAGPDICINLGSESPVNYASRNVLVDLSQFEDFNEVTKRYEERLLTPFKYKGGCYALPLSLSYPVLFVRNDIFDKLGLSVPQTWQDVYDIAAVLQRNHLEMGIPSNVGTFFTMLYQNGGKLFDDNLKTTFSEQNALNAFELWTSFYSKYSFPLTYNFYNRFRSGQMPIGIADYVLYAQIKAFAPEIRGQWSMYQLPGIMSDNGEINRQICISNATGTSGNLGLAQSLTSCVIFRDCKEKEEAFNFLNWFTSDTVQASYGLGIEAALGVSGRYNPVNIGTLAMLPWTRDEHEALLAAREQIIVLPEYPGNYYISREVNNAFRSVVNKQENPVDMISRKNAKINKELARKQAQYGITAKEAVQ